MKSSLRVFVQPLREGLVSLDAAGSRYLTRVHRFRPGATFVAFDPGARQEADAVLTRAGRAAQARLAAPRPASNTSSLRVTLLCGIGKADKPDLVVRAATVLAVRELVLVEAERTVARVTDRAEQRRRRWQSVALDAARQCGRGDLPEIVGPVELARALDLVGARSGLRLLLDPTAGQTIGQMLGGWQPSESIVLLVGPEGGWSHNEVAAAQQAGAVAVSLGPFVLRTETAATAALAALVSRL
jgi:16S rRNA (uracil1498-N3)-methyltransferase